MSKEDELHADEVEQSESSRYVRTGGKWWGAKFEDLCRGHRLYVLKPRTGADERIDLHTSPDGEHVGEPVDYTDCTLCKRDANKHGQGLHGVSAEGCAICGGELKRRQTKGGGGFLNYQKCPNCTPDPLLIRVGRGLKQLVKP